MKIARHGLLAAFLLIQGTGFARGATSGDIPILAYHRFGPVVTDSMTVRTTVFAAELEYLKTHGYTVIPMRALTDFLAGGNAPPAHSVVITADDGHESVYTRMFPLIRRYHIPVTLFIYPSAISNASYAMTWQQLREMQSSNLVDIQSHTYWHPNFKIEKKRLDQRAYDKFVHMQLIDSKVMLEKQFAKQVDMLAWPFGIVDDELMYAARDAGYIAAFTIERRAVKRTDNPMALPRYLMTDAVRFEKLLTSQPIEKTP